MSDTSDTAATEPSSQEESYPVTTENESTFHEGRLVDSPDYPDEVPGSSTIQEEMGHPSSLNIDEDDLILAMNERWNEEIPQANEYDLRTKSAEDLYNDILLQNGYKDNSKGANFKLNSLLMEYIKIKYYIYKLLLKDETKKLYFFKAVFNSCLFFKAFLIKEATAVMPEISESSKLQLHENNQLATSVDDLYDAAEDLYNDILLQNGYKDNNSGDNLKLNHLLMSYIIMRHHIFEHLCSNENLVNKEAPTLDFFKKVFESFFFFKHFLIKMES